MQPPNILDQAPEVKSITKKSHRILFYCGPVVFVIIALAKYFVLTQYPFSSVFNFLIFFKLTALIIDFALILFGIYLLKRETDKRQSRILSGFTVFYILLSLYMILPFLPILLKAIAK